jgi:hypothetical protein
VVLQNRIERMRPATARIDCSTMSAVAQDLQTLGG